MDVGTTLVSDAQAAELMQPRVGAFHNPAVDAQSAAVRRMALGYDRFNAAPLQLSAVASGMIGPVALQALRTPPGSARCPGNWRNGVH